MLILCYQLIWKKRNEDYLLRKIKPHFKVVTLISQSANAWLVHS